MCLQILALWNRLKNKNSKKNNRTLMTQKWRKTQIIDEEYEIGETFSLKDQTLAKMNAKAVHQNTVEPFTSPNFNRSKTVMGITVKVSGTINDKGKNIINQIFEQPN